MGDCLANPRPDMAAAALACWGRSLDGGYFALLGLILALDLAILWSLPILPGQDLPQHLAYARILLDHARPKLAFRGWYQLPAHLQPYFLPHLLIALLGRLLDVLAAIKLL